MKAIRLLLVSFFVLCVSTTTVVASNKSDANESDTAKIKRAIRAAPNQISDHATILDADGTILRGGTNGWTCFPGVPLIPGDKHPMCNDAVWMAWLGAIIDGSIFYDENLNPNPWRPSTIGYSYMLLGDALVNNGNPFATDPNDGGLWDQEGPHLMMLFPTSVDLGHLPSSPHDGGPYVMWGDTDMVHVMVPLTDK
jgi:hypothetical protein